MSFFVRMLEKQKWDNPDLMELGFERIPADTITGDLRTKSNNLSLWSIEKRDMLTDTVLALAIMRNKLTRLDIIILEKSEIDTNELKYENTPKNSNTPLFNFDKNHYDLVNLDYNSLGRFSDIIIKNVGNKEMCIRYSKSTILKMVVDGFKKQKFDIDSIDQNIKNEIIKNLEKEN